MFEKYLESFVSDSNVSMEESIFRKKWWRNEPNWINDKDLDLYLGCEEIKDKE